MKAQMKVQKWKITKLKDHPQQASLFGNVPDIELDALAADMAKRGQDEPVEVLPTGVVVAGHQRLRAARKLGWKMIDVIIRDDLAKAGALAIEDYFIRSNFIRRQLSPLAKARCIRRLMELETGRSADRFLWMKRDDLKKRIGNAMGLCGRSVSRYLAFLETPLPVQQAFDSGAIKLTDGGPIAQLPKDVQATIAARIIAGEDAALVIRDTLSPGKSKSTTTEAAFFRVFRCLRREMPALAGVVDQLDSVVVHKRMSFWLEARQLVEEIIEHGHVVGK